MNARTVSACAMVALYAAVGVQADTVDVHSIGFGVGENVRVVLDGHAHYRFAGQLRNEFSNGTGAGASLSGEVVTYFAGLTEELQTSVTRFEVVSPQNILTPAIGAFKAEALRGLYSFANGQERLAEVDSSYAAAFQLAVWEIVYDFNAEEGAGSLNIDAGNFFVQALKGESLSGAIRGDLTDFFGAALAPSPPNVTLYGLLNASVSDQFVAQSTAVPLPGAGLMGLAGLGALAGRRRRR